MHTDERLQCIGAFGSRGGATASRLLHPRIDSRKIQGHDKVLVFEGIHRACHELMFKTLW